jgi:oligoribonuclease NrnB/cAMP/cGMP phosphodiesterase (DHH superfamily)
VCLRFFRVVVLDHHKTALEKLAETAAGENVTKVIDMERSGATIAFDYFKEKLKLCPNQTVMEVGEFDRLGPLFKYIEDGDLWRWRLPNSKAFSSGLKDSGIEFDVRLNPSLFQQVIHLLGLMIFIPVVFFFWGGTFTENE